MKLLTKLSGTITFKDKQKMRLLLIIFFSGDSIIFHSRTIIL